MAIGFTSITMRSGQLVDTFLTNKRPVSDYQWNNLAQFVRFRDAVKGGGSMCVKVEEFHIGDGCVVPASLEELHRIRVQLFCHELDGVKHDETFHREFIIPRKE